jgi:phage replication-related protein YjqB (UPF0714/DUF867 family)
MADKYSNFTELSENELVERDYRVRCENRKTPIVVIAPHGGWIEPGTSAIATEIARDDLSLYLFEGLIPGRPHGDLHIKSHLFDEPVGVALVEAAETAIAIHGRADNGDPSTIGLGGRDSVLGEAIASSLRQVNFEVARASGDLAGQDRSNICNRGSSEAGVQLELPRTLRDELLGDAARLRAFGDAIRNAIRAPISESLAGR